LFRRLAVFLGGFDLAAAQAAAGSCDVERFQVLDLLTLLVDKSLVVADDSGGQTRFRLLETVRQYAAEKLGESGEADAVRARHRDHYTALAALLDAPARSDYERRLGQAETEIDNLRAAFARSRENSDIDLAMQLASSLQPLWMSRARLREGLTWFDAALTDDNAQHAEVAAAVRARALADRSVLATWAGTADSLDQAQQALVLARELDEPALLAHTLTACGYIAGFYDAEAARGYFAAALAAGDVEAAQHAYEAAGQHLSFLPAMAALQRAYSAAAALAAGDLVAARHGAHEAVTMATGGIYLSQALTTRARVAIAQGEPEQADRDAHEALELAAEVQAYLGISDTLECLGTLAGDAGRHREAARLFGAVHGIRQRMGAVRFKVWDASYEASEKALRDALGEQDFEAAWAEGAALSTEEAIAYAQRGRGERKRPTSGWASLTPAERDVVRLVSEGLGNNDIATRLFVSPRTVQSHLTHVYAKLGLTSRVQLAQEAARRA